MTQEERKGAKPERKDARKSDFRVSFAPLRNFATSR